MAATSDILGEVPDVPPASTVVELDVRDLPPPEPMTETLERLAAMDEDGVLLQRNDRAPEFLFPKLRERGFEFGTVEAEESVYTAIWHAEA